MFTLFLARCLSEAVVEVSAVQPGGSFGTEGIRAFLNFNMLPVHVCETPTSTEASLLNA